MMATATRPGGDDTAASRLPSGSATARKARKRLTREDYVAQAEFRQGLREFLRFSEEATAALGTTPQQYQALLVIKTHAEGSGVTVGQLAEGLNIRHHSTVGLVDRLVQKGLVERKDSATDRRQVCLALTSQGEQILEELVLSHRAGLLQEWDHLKQPIERLQALTTNPTN